MHRTFNSSSRGSLRSASTYEDVSHVTKPIPIRYDSILEPAVGQEDSSSDISGHGKMYRVNLNILPVFFLEAIALGCLGALAYFLRFTDQVPFVSYNLQCNQTSIIPIIGTNQSENFQYRPNENIYVDLSYETFYALILSVPLGMILLGEIGYFLFSKAKKVVRGGCINCRLYLPVRRVVRFSGIFLFGLFAVSILTDSLKLSTGRLRPNGLNINCNVNASEDKKRDASLSFPSFYASAGSYSAMYTMIYIHFLLAIRASRLLRPSLIFTLAALTILCSASRVTLLYNHWEDVIVGLILGSSAAIYLAISTLQCFGKKPQLLINEAYNQMLEPHDSNEKSLFFRYFRIPHVSYQNRTGKPYPEDMQYCESVVIPPPGNDFQKDLHKRIEDFSRRQSLGGGHI